MTRGSKALRHDESIYGQGPGPILLFDRFGWDERDAVLTSLHNIVAAGPPVWTFGGAYLFWSQFQTCTGDGTLLYCGETDDFGQRQRNHLLGPLSGGNKFRDLAKYFETAEDRICGLGLLVIAPASLPWLHPPDDPSFLEDGAAKRAGERLEGLLLKAAINLTGDLPLFNNRDDSSKYAHSDDVPRFWSLLRYLFDHRDATMDFPTYWIRAEQREAHGVLARLVSDCPYLSAP